MGAPNLFLATGAIYPRYAPVFKYFDIYATADETKFLNGVRRFISIVSK